MLVASCTTIQIHSNGFRGSIDSPLRSIQTGFCISCTTIWKDPNKVLYQLTYHSKPFGESTLYTVISPFKTTIANGFKWCINLYEKGTKSRRVIKCHSDLHVTVYSQCDQTRKLFLGFKSVDQFFLATTSYKDWARYMNVHVHVNQACVFSGFFFYKSPFASKCSWKKRSSHQGKKEVAHIVSKTWSFFCGNVESVNPPKLNIQEVWRFGGWGGGRTRHLSSGLKRDPVLPPILGGFFYVKSHPTFIPNL